MLKDSVLILKLVAAYLLKTKNNWLIWIESTYIFGGKIREKQCFWRNY
jgi:hypothetical protein